MKTHLTRFFLLLISAPLFSQSFPWASQGGGSGNDAGYGISHDANGNTYVAGSYSATATFGSFTLSGNNGSFSNAFVAKYDASGNVVWAKKGGTPNKNDGAYAIATDAAGNSYVTGYFQDTAAFGAFTLISSGMEDVFVVKYDMNGNELWAKRFGNTGSEFGYGIGIDGSGNCYVTDNIFMITKYNTNGALQWTFTVSGQRTIHGIRTDNAGNSYITGTYTNTLYVGTYTLLNSGGTDIFVAKISPVGSVLWASRLGGAGDDDGRAIQLDAQNNIYLAGFMNNPGGQAFITKIYASGNNGWMRTASGTNAAYGLGTDSYGNSVMTGFISSNSTFGNFNLSDVNTSDLFIAQYDSAGNCRWAMNTGGASMNQGYGVTLDDQCHARITGYFETGATFGTNNLSAGGQGNEVFVVLSDNNCATGIMEEKNNEVTVIPNPTNGVITLPHAEGEVFIYDILGNEIIYSRINGNSSFDLSSFPPGIYILKVQNGVKYSVRRVVKQ
ncbi:MAG TPA: T9SS type A sorting domain-containing protein [Bacteroidia bacterium]